MHSYLFVFFFGQSTGKADKFLYVLNMLDVLRESLILVAGVFGLAYARIMDFEPSHFLLFRCCIS
jgi:hypothetical protein